MELKKYIQSFNVFLPINRFWFKVLLYVIFPVLVIVGTTILNPYVIVINAMDNLASSHLIPGIILLASYIILNLDGFVDYYIFGGIASKNGTPLEYLKSSTNGLNCIQKALITDSIRQFLLILITEYGVYLTLAIHLKTSCTEYLLLTGLLAVLTFICEQISLWITRIHYVSIFISITMITIIGGLILFQFGQLYINWNNHNQIIIMSFVLILELLLAVCISLFQIRHLMSCERRSYYDERC